MNKTNERMIFVPRNWAIGDQEYILFIDSDELQSSYMPEGNISRVKQEIKKWEDKLAITENERTVIRYTGFLESGVRALNKIEEEDEKRESDCLHSGIDEQKFLKMLSLFNSPKIGSIESIYVVKQNNSDMYKIGVSNVPERRLKEFETSNPYGAELIIYYTGVKCYEREKQLHRHFSNERIRKDAEWFELDRLDLISIKKTFEYWLEEDKDDLDYLETESSSIGIYERPFVKWTENDYNGMWRDDNLLL